MKIESFNMGNGIELGIYLFPERDLTNHSLLTNDQNNSLFYIFKHFKNILKLSIKSYKTTKFNLYNIIFFYKQNIR